MNDVGCLYPTVGVDDRSCAASKTFARRQRGIVTPSAAGRGGGAAGIGPKHHVVTTVLGRRFYLSPARAQKSPRPHVMTLKLEECEARKRLAHELLRGRSFFSFFCFVLTIQQESLSLVCGY